MTLSMFLFLLFAYGLLLLIDHLDLIAYLLLNFFLHFIKTPLPLLLNKVLIYYTLHTLILLNLLNFATTNLLNPINTNTTILSITFTVLLFREC